MKTQIKLLVIALSLIATTSNAQWTNMDIGIGGNLVYALDTLQGELYVGGYFTTAGKTGTTINCAAWNGTSWSVNCSFSAINENIYALITFNGNLYAGYYGGIAKWNGASWSKIGGGGGNATTGTVYALAVYNGNLYAGGEFTSMYGTSNANNIAEWNGTSWVVLSTGITGGTGIVKSLAVYNGNLYASGNFTTAGSTTVSDIAEWNGTSWTALSTGTNGTVNTMAVYSGELFVGGSFSTAGGLSVTNIAGWNGSTWSAPSGIGTNAVSAMAVSNGNLYVGGEYIYEWNGTSATSLGSFGTSLEEIDAIATYNSNLYAGGEFTTINSATGYSNIAEYTAPTSINEIQDTSSFTAYPNPFSNNLNLYLPKEANVQVYDEIGQLIFQSRMPQGHNHVNIQDATGLYLLSVDGVFRKLVKE